MTTAMATAKNHVDVEFAFLRPPQAVSMPEPSLETRDTPLEDFIAINREGIIRRCRVLATQRVAPAPTDVEVGESIPMLLDHLVAEFGNEPPKARELSQDATHHGQELFFQGFTIGQVVHDYGDVFEAVTGLAVDLGATISSEDFRTLNRCLDNAIAGAVSEYSRQQEIATDDRSVNQCLALQKMLFTVSKAFHALRSGDLGAGGATGDLIQRTLTAMHERLSSTV